MRETRPARISIFESYAEHEQAVQLKQLSSILDNHPEILNVIKKILIKISIRKAELGIPYASMGVRIKTLRNFRASVEGNISELKRTFGTSKALVFLSVTSYSLAGWR